MKIYEHAPLELLRISICKAGEEAQYLNIQDATAEQFESFVTALIAKQNLSIFDKGKRTSINIRRAIGGKNLESRTISFRGLSPVEVVNLIKNAI